MTSRALVNLALMLKAYRDYPDLQITTRAMIQHLHEYLKRNGLYASGELAHLSEVFDDFVIRSEDVTPLGLMLFVGPGNAFEKWLRANDNPQKSKISMRALDDGLRKLTSKS